MVRAINEIMPEIDWLFIDGDHRYEEVCKDWENYSPLVRKDGLIVLHDILQDETDSEIKVYRLWQELKQDHKTKELMSGIDQKSRGIGIVYV